jgi:hypothetical protein
VDNLLGIIGEDHVSHGMSHMFTDPNKTSTPFSRVGRKLASSSLKYTGSHHQKLRRGLISGVEPVSVSIGVRQLRDDEAVKFKTKQTYITSTQGARFAGAILCGP